MDRDKIINELRPLPTSILDEVVREGELMIQAQFQSHLSTDQRAFTFAGLILAAATAATGAAVALTRSNTPDYDLAQIAGWFAAGLITAGGVAITSAWPRKFCFPGNEPISWKPDGWSSASGIGWSPKRTRLEQAAVLQSMISKNRSVAKLKARIQLASFIVAYAVCLASGIALVCSFR